MVFGTANEQREEAVCSALGGATCNVCPADQAQCKHGFNFAIPDTVTLPDGTVVNLKDGNTHTAYAYGINIGGGTNSLIGQVNFGCTPECTSFSNLYINSCNSTTKWSGATPSLRDNNACQTQSRDVTLNIVPGNATSMSFYEPPPADDAKYCTTDFADSYFPSPSPAAASQSWTVASGTTDPVGDPGKKRVCVRLENWAGSATWLRDRLQT